MATKNIKMHSVAAALAAALSLAAVTPSAARWDHPAAAIGAGAAGFAAGAAAATVAPPYYGDDGYYDYAPAPVVAPGPYYDYDGPYWTVRRGNRPGCGAGAPHC